MRRVCTFAIWLIVAFVALLTGTALAGTLTPLVLPIITAAP